MRFRVMDNKTGKEANPYKIALHEEWAQGLVYCDMEGFAITEDGDLVLMDECGSVVYCDPDRFKVVFDDERPQWIPCSERLPEDPDTKRIYASKTYQVTTVDGRTIVLLWRKTESRGKMVMRWEWHDGRIYHGDVLAWKPLSEPYKREGEKE